MQLLETDRSIRSVITIGGGGSALVFELAAAALLGTSAAAAQNGPPTNLVSVCSGVSLPRSAITDTIAPVVTGIVSPTQGAINGLLGALGTPFTIDAAGLLTTAASGQPIRLQVLDTNGNLIGAGAACNAQADSVTLANPRGVEIGGNGLTGLGRAGQAATAGTLDAIAIGNGATTDPTTQAAVALGADAQVAPGATGSLALGAGTRVQSANSVAIGAGSVANRGTPEVSFGAAGAERLLTNVASGTLAANSTDAVNAGQLYATNLQVGSNTTSIDNLTTNVSNGAVGPLRYSNAAAPTVPNGGVPSNDATLFGAAPGAVGLHNVAGGVVAAGSLDAVNGGQLAAVQAAAANAVTYDLDAGGNRTDRVTLAGGAGGGSVTITNAADGRVAAGSRDVVTGNQLFTANQNIASNTTAITNLQTTVAGNTTAIDNLNTSVATNATAITNLTTQVASGALGPVRYADAATPTTPNGGVPSNDVTLVGAAPGAVGLHNVAAGVVAAGSTDAVNGGQVYAIAARAVNAVSYDTDAAGNRINSVTLAGGQSGAVTIGNVAAGVVAAGSAQAVNGSQLAATNAAVTTAQSTATTALTTAGTAQSTATTALTTANTAQTTAITALTLGQNSVQYDQGRSGVTLNPGGGAIQEHNVAAGTAATDAVNVAQLNNGLAGAMSQANGYTDRRLASISYDLKNVRRDADAGSATALAAAGLPQAFTPGAGMIALGGGTYGGESALAVGFSKAFDDGHTVVKIAGSHDTRGRTGASGGIGYQF